MQSFSLPTKICFGENCDIILSEFSEPFIVCDSFFKDSQLLGKITDKFKDFTVFSDFTPDPTLEAVSRGIAEFKKQNRKSLIALGGGSAIDTAKAMLKFMDEKNLKFAAIPTTSGTGSEVTSFSVVTDSKSHSKYPIVSDDLRPEYAILNTEYVKSVPSAVVADTGADVLCHALESYVSKNSNPFTDALCEKAIKLTFENLKKSFLGDMNARENMHFASCMAGLAFDQTNLGLCHAIAHNCGAKIGLSHGKTNSILLNHVISFNSEVKKYTDNPTPAGLKYAEISKLLGNNGTTAVLVKKLILSISKLFDDINLPDSFTKAKVDKKLLEEITESTAEGALKDGCIQSNPKEVLKSDVINIFKEAF